MDRSVSAPVTRTEAWRPSTELFEAGYLTAQGSAGRLIRLLLTDRVVAPTKLIVPPTVGRQQSRPYRLFGINHEEGSRAGMRRMGPKAADAGATRQCRRELSAVFVWILGRWPTGR